MDKIFFEIKTDTLKHIITTFENRFKTKTREDHKSNGVVLESIDSLILKAYRVKPLEDVSILIFTDENTYLFYGNDKFGKTNTFSFSISEIIESIKEKNQTLYERIIESKTMGECVYHCTKDELKQIEEINEDFIKSLDQKIKTISNKLILADLTEHKLLTKIYKLKTILLKALNNKSILEHNFSFRNNDVLILTESFIDAHLRSLLNDKETFPFSLELKVSINAYEEDIVIIEKDRIIESSTIDISLILKEKYNSDQLKLLLNPDTNNNIILILKNFDGRVICTKKYSWREKISKKQLFDLELQLDWSLRLNLIAKNNTHVTNTVELKLEELIDAV